MKTTEWITGRAALHAIISHGVTAYVHNPQSGKQLAGEGAVRRAHFWSVSAEPYKSPFYIKADAVSSEQRCACCW